MLFAPAGRAGLSLLRLHGGVASLLGAPPAIPSPEPPAAPAAPAADGGYKTIVRIFNPWTGKWLTKPSTMFPDKMSQAQVLKAIRHATANMIGREGDAFIGASGRGFKIKFVLNPQGRVKTAFMLKYDLLARRDEGRSSRSQRLRTMRRPLDRRGGRVADAGRPGRRPAASEVGNVSRHGLRCARKAAG